MDAATASGRHAARPSRTCRRALYARAGGRRARRCRLGRSLWRPGGTGLTLAGSERRKRHGDLSGRPRHRGCCRGAAAPVPLAETLAAGCCWPGRPGHPGRPLTVASLRDGARHRALARRCAGAVRTAGHDGGRGSGEHGDWLAVLARPATAGTAATWLANPGRRRPGRQTRGARRPAGTADYARCLLRLFRSLSSAGRPAGPRSDHKVREEREQFGRPLAKFPTVAAGNSPGWPARSP